MWSANILQCAHGKEFVNTIVEEYLKIQGIKYEHGRPYHPQSQGLIERANRTIQDALNRKYHGKPDEFDIESILIDILAEYNSALHTTTRIAPKIAFNLNQNNKDDHDLLSFIRENTIKALKNKITKIKFSEGDKVLIYNAIHKGKEGYLRKTNSKKKISKGYTIPAIVFTVEASYLVISIVQNFKIMGSELKKEECFKITKNLAQKVNEKRWTSFITK